ncbi:MAG: hypothetical protein FWG44_03025 [Oscillospiraceae bacterium]|nr:hypothetical protein [Oscillospiraceae bacterium]
MNYLHKTVYYALFNQMTDTIRVLEKECEKLKYAQRAVEFYIIDYEKNIEDEAENKKITGEI